MTEKIKTIGTREEVYHGRAKHTLGGLYKDDIFINRKGDYASRKMSNAVKSRFIQLFKPKDETTAPAAPADTVTTAPVDTVTVTTTAPVTVTTATVTTTAPVDVANINDNTVNSVEEKLEAVQFSSDLPYVKRVKTAFLQIRGVLPNRGKIRVFYDQIMEDVSHINKTPEELRAFIISEAKVQKIKL